MADFGVGGYTLGNNPELSRKEIDDQIVLFNS